MRTPHKSRTYEYDEAQQKLKLHGNNFPKEALRFVGEVDIVDMSHSQLETLPDEFADLNPRVVFGSFTPFKEIPEVFSACSRLEMLGFKGCDIEHVSETALPSSLKVLTLTNNRLTRLPRSLGHLPNLKKIMVADNQLRTLPETLRQCEHIELLRLANNQFDEPPTWLLDLPKLGWYTDDGDALDDSINTSSTFKTIAWHDVKLGEMLGKSANNLVYRAQLASGQDVAVKLFGNGAAIPSAELQASLLAGDHAKLVGGIGLLSRAPEGQFGMVLPLVSPEEFHILAKPPDFHTFTRDVFTNNTKFSPDFIHTVLADVAEALAFSHSQGVMNGDIYGHNIFVNTAGHAKVSDFGDASIYGVNSKDAIRRQQVDVRGFGYLADDLLRRVTAEAGEYATSHLQQLRAACLSSHFNELPLFGDIRSFLAR